MIYDKIDFIKNHCELTVNCDGLLCVVKLIPVNSVTIRQYDPVEKMTNWRNKYCQWFLTQFNATSERTQKWLDRVVIPQSDRILFLITVDGDVVGHIGLCHITEKTIELDNAINTSPVKSLFPNVEWTLLNFIFTVLEMDVAVARYFSHNRVQILHRWFGFEPQTKSFLNKKEFPDSNTVFEECPEQQSNVSFQYVTAKLTCESFVNNKEAYSVSGSDKLHCNCFD